MFKGKMKQYSYSIPTTVTDEYNYSYDTYTSAGNIYMYITEQERGYYTGNELKL